MNAVKISPLALVSALFLGLTALLPLAANAQPLDPAVNIQIQSFPVGNGPEFLVTNSFVLDNTVTAVRAYNGAIMGTVPVGTYPQGIAFDGQHIWVANFDRDSVSVIEARNGAYLRTIRVEDGPQGVCFDGTSIWVANSGSNTVSKITYSSR